MTTAAPPPARPRLTAALALVLVAVVALGLPALGLGPEDVFQRLRTHRDDLQDFAARYPLPTLVVFAVGGAVLMGLSFPFSWAISLAAGVLFGRWAGTLVMSGTSTVGACLAFLGSRYLFREAVRQRFARWAEVIDRGVTREGAYYLFLLRLTPLVPFFVINAVMGLTAMRLRTFGWVSWLGMLPATFLWVNCGTELGRITTLREAARPELVGAFVLLGVGPLLIKWLVGRRAGPGA
jgi:uncharacterized membrane protein YdjX (TVP38/TMEM64 family)